MRGITGFIVLIALAGAVHGQPPVIRTVSGTAPVSPVARQVTPFDRFRNPAALPAFSQQLFASALAGSEWLANFQQPHGRFLPGYNPALNQPLEADHFLKQAAASHALARTAGFTRNEKTIVRANQAVLTLLSQTTLENGLRIPALPTMICNRPAAAAWMILAIAELPDPAIDLVGKAEELAQFLKTQQQADGSWKLLETDAPNKLDAEMAHAHAGWATAALMASHKLQPAAWKLDASRKAVAFYRVWFKANAHPGMIAGMTAACTEAFPVTKDPLFAEFAFEMNDWLCLLQYEESPDPRRPLWRGGFRTIEAGKTRQDAPTIDAAAYAQSLTDACRLIRRMAQPDLTRFDRYRTAATRTMQFLTTLQFNETNTMHIAGQYRMFVLGGFHATHADGNVRIEQTAQAVATLVAFLANGFDHD